MPEMVSTGSGVIVDIPGGWATIIVALITFVLGPWVSTVVAARIANRVRRIDEKTDRTLDQVENNHRKPDGTPINLREEQDDRHSEIVSLLRDHGEILEEHGKQLKMLTQSDADQNEWIDDFSRTWPRSRFMPPARHRAPDPAEKREP